MQTHPAKSRARASRGGRASECGGACVDARASEKLHARASWGLSFPHSDLYGILYVNVIIDNYRHTRKQYWQFMSELIPCDGIVEYNKFWRHNFFLE